MLSLNLMNRCPPAVQRRPRWPHASRNPQVCLWLRQPQKSMTGSLFSPLRSWSCKKNIFHVQVGNISSLLDVLSPLSPVESEHPLTFEEMKQVGCQVDGKPLETWRTSKLLRLQPIASIVFSSMDTCCTGPCCPGTSQSPRHLSLR